MSTEQLLADADADSFRPQDRREIADWARDSIVVGSWSPWPGPFDPSLTPWIIEPLRVLGIPGPRRVTITGPAAGGKSTIGEVFAAWCVDNAPGLTSWFAHTDEMAKEFAETRLHRMFAVCPRVARWFDLMPRHAKRTQAIHFPHMSFLVQAANETNAQSKHIRHLILDETWQYAPGIVAQLHKRTTRFAHNRTILELSTGSLEGDETDTAWNQGTRQRWQIVCPHCGRLHVPRWSFGRHGEVGGVKWDQSAKRDDGTWDMRRVAESTAYECPLCVHRIQANASNAILVNRGGRYTEPAEDAMPRHWSFHWNCIASDFAQLGAIAVEFLGAQAELKRGKTVLLQEFRQKKEALAWADEPPSIRIADTAGDYVMGQPWEREAFRIMLVDVQQTHFWALIRLFAADGESRLFACERLETWEAVRAFQTKHGVTNESVLVDSGHKTDDTYAHCCLWGWFAMKGAEARDGFLVDGRKVIACWSMDGAIPTRFAPAYLLPNSVKSWTEVVQVSKALTTGMMAQARAGKLVGCTIPKDAPDYYTAQMAARIFDDKKKAWRTVGKCGEHLWDCERYALAAGFMAGCFDAQQTDNTNDEPKEENAAA